MCCPAKQTRASFLHPLKETMLSTKLLLCYSRGPNPVSLCSPPDIPYWGRSQPNTFEELLQESTSLTSSAAFFQSMRMTKAEKDRDCKEMQMIIPTHRPVRRERYFSKGLRKPSFCQSLLKGPRTSVG